MSKNPRRGRIFVLCDRARVVGAAKPLFTVITAKGLPVVLLEDVIVAVRTRESVEGSGLRIGSEAWALAKAPRLSYWL